jgi:hypothetical protein
VAATMTEKAMAARPNLQRAIVGLCFLLVLVAYVVIWLSSTVGPDWRDCIAPAGRGWWDPYQVSFHNPPWVALRLWPIALLPLRAGFILNELWMGSLCCRHRR